MVVDDHRDTVELIAFVLHREGAEVRTALSAQEALAAWLQRPADVLVTDLSMPGMDGFALLAALSRDGDVQAIALSGLARADDRQRALQAGFVAHLAKPVEPSGAHRDAGQASGRSASSAAREFPRPLTGAPHHFCGMVQR